MPKALAFCHQIGPPAQDMKVIFSLSIKELEIIDFVLDLSLKDEVLTVMPMQEQIWVCQKTGSGFCP